jgi:hypothetical protein
MVPLFVLMLHVTLNDSESHTLPLFVKLAYCRVHASCHRLTTGRAKEKLT